MTPEQEILMGRLRSLLIDAPAMREVSMFGGKSIMIREKMIVSVLKNGGLLVRVNADRHGELLNRPGATQAEMGADRTMGPGWIEIAATALADDESLSYWVDIAMEYNRAITKRAV